MHIGSAGSNFKDWLDLSNNSILVSVDGNKSNSKNDKIFKTYRSSKEIRSHKQGCDSQDKVW